MTNPSTAAPARFYEWPYWQELAEFCGSEDQLEWTNVPDKMDLDDLYFVPGSNCLATELRIDGLGPMLKSLLVETVYILKDKEGFYYMKDIEETTPLVAFSQVLDDEGLGAASWNCCISAMLRSGVVVYANNPEAPRFKQRQQESKEAQASAKDSGTVGQWDRLLISTQPDFFRGVRGEGIIENSDGSVHEPRLGPWSRQRCIV